MAHFITLVSHRGAFSADFAQQPGPDPAISACRPRTTAHGPTHSLDSPSWGLSSAEPDFDALRAASTRIVMAAGVESEGELANRGAFAVAERLGTAPVIFPSNHGGFLGGEYGQTGDPDAFAAKLRDVVAEG